MDILAVMYVVASYVDIFAVIPQFIAIHKARSSASVSLLMWVMWTITQTIITLYIYREGDTLMKIISSTWLVMDVSLIGFILYYRYVYKPEKF